MIAVTESKTKKRSLMSRQRVPTQCGRSLFTGLPVVRSPSPLGGCHLLKLPKSNQTRFEQNQNSERKGKNKALITIVFSYLAAPAIASLTVTDRPSCCYYTNVSKDSQKYSPIYTLLSVMAKPLVKLVSCRGCYQNCNMS